MLCEYIFAYCDLISTQNYIAVAKYLLTKADAVLSGGAVRRKKGCGAVSRARHRVGRTDMKPHDAGDIESIPPGQT